jgi:hypothetical protein
LLSQVTFPFLYLAKTFTNPPKEIELFPPADQFVNDTCCPLIDITPPTFHGLTLSAAIAFNLSISACTFAASSLVTSCEKLLTAANYSWIQKIIFFI